MTTFIGFNTQYVDRIKTPQQQRGVVPTIGSLTTPMQSGKKFRLTDEQLAIQDFINALNIHMGEKPGNPSYGTTIWSFIFEPNDPATADKIQEEITRLALQDPRIDLQNVNVYAVDYGVLVEIQISVNPFNNPLILQIVFDQGTNKAYTS